MNTRIKEVLLSEYGRLSLTPSPVSRMMASFAHDFRENIDINLGVGYVNENTIPRELIQEALDHVLSNPRTHKAALNYGGPRGSQNLIDALHSFYISAAIGGITEDILGRHEIIIGPNGATSILEGLADILKPGIVITSDPMYYIYCNYLERKGFSIVTVPEDRDGLHAAAVAEKLDKMGAECANISFFYFVTVNNPSASILSNEARKNIVSLVADLSAKYKRKIPLVLDTAYERLIHDPTVAPPQSGLLHDEEGIVYEIGTLSKILAPALRIGYVIGRQGPLIDALIQRTSDVGFSAPLITQEIASYLLNKYIDQQEEFVRRGYRKKSHEIALSIDQYLGDFVEERRGGQAGFYFYLTLADIETHERSAFFKYLSRSTGISDIDGAPTHKNPRVIYIPGEFCVHSRGDMVEKGKRQLRISYGFEESGKIKEALSYMEEAVKYSIKNNS